MAQTSLAVPPARRPADTAYLDTALADRALREAGRDVQALAPFVGLLGCGDAIWAYYEVTGQTEKALGLALPALAESDTVKDAKDNAANAQDTVKDKLGTDSGAAKTKRHAKRSVRNAKKDARHKKNAVKKDVNDATK